MPRLVSLAALVVCLAFAAGPALAGKPGAGGSSSTGDAWVSASPNPAAAWGTRVDLTGCGYSFAGATVRVVHPAGTDQFTVGMWSTGCMDTVYFTTREPGTYTVNVYQAGGTKRRPTLTLKASTLLTVQ